jgi:molybdopterin-guanine dinucleotide biosynthesis protein A
MADAPPTRFGAVVLAGGSAVRMDGADKAAVELDGSTLLERALAALTSADEVVVVGDAVPTSRPVSFLREDPAYGGPAAALLAGLAGFAVRPDVVVAVAVDMPRVTTSTVDRLLDALVRGGVEDDEVDGAVLHDGRQQPLCAAYRTGALLAAAPAYDGRHGLSMRRLVGGLRLAAVPALGDEARDVDSWQDLLSLREHRDTPG